MTIQALMEAAKPITFTAEVAAAVAEGRKTRTMRVMKDYQAPAACPVCGSQALVSQEKTVLHVEIDRHDSTGNWCVFCTDCGAARDIAPPKYKPGDVLAVQLPDGCVSENPTFLRVTMVKAQQAMDVSPDEAVAEGVRVEIDLRPYCEPFGRKEVPLHEVAAVMNEAILNAWDRLFRSIYPEDRFGENPWCWVYAFEKVEEEHVP
jgi:hypothetical protein